MMRVTQHRTSIHLNRLCFQIACLLALDIWAFSMCVMNPKCVPLMSQIHLNLRNHLGVSTCSIRTPNLVGQICSFCALTFIKSSDIQSIKNPLDHVVACVHLAVWTSWYLQQPVVQSHTAHNHQRTICPSDGSREIDLPKSCNQHLPFLLAVSCIYIALKRMLVWRRT